MYSIRISATDKDKKVYEVFSTPLKRSELSSYIIKQMFESLIAAPFYCLTDMMSITNDDTGANSCCMFYTDDNKHNECVAIAWFKGWLARDEETTCEHEDDKSDDGECGDLVSKYNELASKYNAIAEGPIIITGSEDDNSRKRSKLFI